jgi:beta-glucosidase
MHALPGKTRPRERPALQYHSMRKIGFPKGFTWGASTSAYQIEGHPLEDGAGPSNWHEFTRLSGRIKDGTNGDLAADHYTRYREDIRHMRDLGLSAYRFSMAWTRIFPEPGKQNQKGLDFYDRLVDAILEAGIEPWITIFHLEEPVWISRMGGMAARDSVNHLVEFGVALMRRFGDRVKKWITINEPTIYAYSGYGVGEFPPGRKNNLRGMLGSAHNLLLSHARLCDAFPSIVCGGDIGLAHHFIWVSPANERKPRDREAAAFMDDAGNGSILDPLFFGSYPPRIAKRLRLFLPRGFEKDLPEMKKPGTYVGINYYTRNLYRYSFFLPFMHAVEHIDAKSRRSAMWEIYPRGLINALMRLKERYGNPPCYITENGFPLPEAEGRDPLEDDDRITYIREHVAMVGLAMERGVDCRGYFHWSLLDNFEWNWGTSMRFGLIRTDFNTQERKWKKSAHWYKDLIARNSLEIEGDVPE